MTREEWLQSLIKRGWSDSDISKARFAWNAAEREVDRAAREDCAEICERIDLSSGVYSDIALDCAKEIRKTIK